MIRMTKLTTGMLVGLGAALVGSWFYAQRESGESTYADRGEVIFRNTPVAD
jgi:hypothetical protein